MSLSEIGFGPAARRWFEDRFGEPTPVQRAGWERIAAGEHALLVAPTGSGKTLAAFFYCIDRLSRGVAPAAPGVRVLYVSPLKALVYDIERNLRAPLAGLAREAERGAEGGGEGKAERRAEPGREPLRLPRVAIRTGDTPQRERRLQARDPAEILVTTPESLYLLLGSRQREALRAVDTVIVDEIHALAASKRGAHLAVSLERLAAWTGRDPQRIGLSATARPLAEIGRFLGGDRPVSLVDTSQPPRLDLSVSVPVPDLTRPDLREDGEGGLVPVAGGDAAGEGAAGEGEGPGAGAPGRGGAAAAPPSIWPALYPRLLEHIRAHRSSIVFVNSRGLCEKLADELNALAGEELVLTHHGSISHDQRREVEEALKAGLVRGIVATSSLELGIDMGAVDLVVLVESPGAVARGLQRVGRAGHQVGAASAGVIYPKHRGDLLEAVVVADGMRRGEVEAQAMPRNPLDVAAQQIVAMAGQDRWAVDDLLALLQRAAPFRDLTRDLLETVLDMLAGRYPSTEFSELRPRLTWDREADTVEGRPGAARLAILSGGTIPDRGLYAVHLGEGGPRIGELDEEMVHETRPGDVVTLGASSWRVTAIGRDRVTVVPAPGEAGRLPFWRGEGPGRPLELGRRLGAFTRELAERAHAGGRDAAEAWLRETHALDAWAARNLVDYVEAQQETTGRLPTDRAITLERFRDELGDWLVCILSPFGTRVHAPWALAVEARLSRDAGYDVQALWSDDGIVLRFADADLLPEGSAFLPDPEDVEEQVVAQLGRSSLFAAQFRENAARALLLPRRRPGARTPLWTQRLRAQRLLAVARGYPSFPIMLETYRACLQDVFDLPSLRELLSDVRSGRVAVDEVETREASPFARSLVFAYTAAYLYQADMPLAERRAHALSLDRRMLRELLGEEELRELLDADAIDAVEAELQRRAPERRARDAEGLADLLRLLGDLDEDEIAQRCSGGAAPAAEWVRALAGAGRIVSLSIGGAARWVASEDAALYRDALGVDLPGGLPDALLAPTERPLEQLLLRQARQRGPFVSGTLAARFGVPVGLLEPVLEALVERGRLLAGEFHPRGRSREWCDPDVLRRLRRRTLARLRDEVAPVEPPVVARFLADWHGVARPARGEARLDEVLDQLEGWPVSFAELERAILPARVEGYEPGQLDQRGALGQWVWIGRGALGERDGRIALYRRERVALLAEPPAPPAELGPLARRVHDTLERQGASFFDELVRACDGASSAAVFEALWEGVWAGLVTNDAFAPLRALAPARPAARAGARSRGRGLRGRGRPGAHARPPGSAGRWSLVASLVGEPPAPTERAHARAQLLLERYGVLSREAMALEEIAGGFAAVYPMLRAMEEAGKIRRGHFVAGYAGAQFAGAAAVDRLRAARERAATAEGLALSAVDPASPWGALLPWPAPSHEDARPRRLVGATVVSVAGEPVLWAGRGARSIWTFPRAAEAAEGAAGTDVLLSAARALTEALLPRSRKTLQLETVDDEPAASTPAGEAFARAGWRRAYRGLELDRYGYTRERRGGPGSGH